MSINIGNSKIGKIYIGSTAIGKVYKGSELMWESGPSLRLYGATSTFDGETVNSYLIGDWSANGIVANWGKPLTIMDMTGVLGSSGSKVKYKLTEGASTSTAPYYSTMEVCGIKIYAYRATQDLFTALVLEGSVVGSVFISVAGWGNPTSITSSTFTWAGYTYTKDSSTDATWYLTGVK